VRVQSAPQEPKAALSRCRRSRRAWGCQQPSARSTETTVNGNMFTEAGFAIIDIRNNTGGNLGEALVVRFKVLRPSNT
jgi:hypothetical protein